MRKTNEKLSMLLVGFLILVLTVSLAGCGKKDSKKEDATVDNSVVDSTNNDTATPTPSPAQNVDQDDESLYQTTIATLTDQQHYALVDMGLSHKVLFTTDMTYDNGDGTMVSITAEVYYICDGQVKDLGKLEGNSTAYPIGYDNTGIYVAYEHTDEKFTIDEAKCELVKSVGIYEKYETDDKATYTKLEDGQEVKAEENEFMSFLDDYNKCTFVNFNDGVAK